MLAILWIRSRRSRAGFKGRIDPLPQAWREEPVVILEDSVIFTLIPGKEVNRVERREARRGRSQRILTGYGASKALAARSRTRTPAADP